MPRPPERDADGNVVPHNHPDILDTYHVIRHIVPYDLYLDPATGLRRVASGAYSESGDDIGGMSVDIEEWMHADGLDPLHYIRDPSHGARRINVGELRAKGFQVGWHPQDGNDHHGAVWGIGNGSKRKRKIAAIAVLLRKAKGED